MKVVTAFSVLGAVAAADAASQTYLGRINVDNAAFPILTAGEKEGDTDLWITQFTGNPFAQGKLSVIRSVNSLAGNVTGAKLEQLGAKFAWPNVLSRAPSKVFDDYTLIVPDGFLVPGARQSIPPCMCAADARVDGDRVAQERATATSTLSPRAPRLRPPPRWRSPRPRAAGSTTR